MAQVTHWSILWTGSFPPGTKHSWSMNPPIDDKDAIIVTAHAYLIKLRSSQYINAPNELSVTDVKLSIHDYDGYAERVLRFALHNTGPNTVYAYSVNVGSVKP